MTIKYEGKLFGVDFYSDFVGKLVCSQPTWPRDISKMIAKRKLNKQMREYGFTV